MLRLVPPIVLLALLATAAPAAGAGAWRRPVDGPLLRTFKLAGDRYARGQHRGVDLGAPRGAPARSACAGEVSFAGRVPGGGRTVSIRCGGLVASYQQLGAIAVGVGRRVGRGERIGFVGRSGDPRERRPHLHLGVREIASGRYLDPMTLLAGAPPRAVPLLAPRRVGPRRVPLLAPRRVGPRRPVPLLAPRRVAPPRAVPLRAPGRFAVTRPAAPVPARPAPALVRPAGEPGSNRTPRLPGPGRAPALPWTVWVGLAGIASAMPVGGLVALRRRRRHTTGRPVAAVR